MLHHLDVTRQNTYPVVDELERPHEGFEMFMVISSHLSSSAKS